MADLKHYYLDSQKKWHPINLAPGRKLASGAAGDVYEIADDKVAKIYNGNQANENKNDLFQKIIIMSFKFHRLAELRDRPLAWPLGPIIASKASRGSDLKPNEQIDEDEFCGFVMPRIHDVYGLEDVIAAPRLGTVPVTGKDRIRIARRIAEIVGICHDAKFIIGDINMRNIVVSGKTLTPTIIDCDSFQFTTRAMKKFTTDVGMIDFSSPDLLRRAEQNGGKFAGLERTRADDCHALAVVIFKLLMNGRHPYDDEHGLPAISDLKRAILARSFPYSAGSSSKPPTKREAERYGGIDKDVRELFEKAFHLGMPVEAADWIGALDHYAGSSASEAIKPPAAAPRVQVMLDTIVQAPPPVEQTSRKGAIITLIVIVLAILLLIFLGGS
jgi:DNA-binding helix-hairpin-helix protein with protein kinase domain